MKRAYIDHVTLEANVKPEFSNNHYTGRLHTEVVARMPWVVFNEKGFATIRDKYVILFFDTMDEHALESWLGHPVDHESYSGIEEGLLNLWKKWAGARPAQSGEMDRIAMTA